MILEVIHNDVDSDDNNADNDDVYDNAIIQYG